jgi:hypothetical protein
MASIKNYISIEPKKWAKTLTIITAMCGIYQLVLGEDLFTLVYALFGIYIGLFVFSRFSATNSGAWFLFFYLFGNTLFAVILKSILSQTLSSYAYSAQASYFVEMLGISMMGLALLCVSKLGVGRPIFVPLLDVDRLNVFSIVAFVVGCIGWKFSGALNVQSDIGNVTGNGFSVFKDAIFMSIICRTAVVILKDKTKYPFDFILFTMIAVAVLLGSVSNSKTYIALPVVAYIVTIIFFKKAIPIGYIASIAIAGEIFSNVIAPMMQALRYLGQQSLSVSARIDLIVRGFDSLISGTDLAAYMKSTTTLWGGDYYDYFGPNGFGQTLAGRYASIQQIDPVVVAAQKFGQFSYPLIVNSIKGAVPGILYSQKPLYGSPFEILVHYGIIPFYSGKNPTLPLMGQTCAVYGLVWGCVVAFFVFFFFLLFLKKIGFDLYRNVFAIFFLVQFTVVYASQGVIEQYLDQILREFPTWVILFLIIQKLPKRMLMIRSTDHMEKPNNVLR